MSNTSRYEDITLNIKIIHKPEHTLVDKDTFIEVYYNDTLLLQVYRGSNVVVNQVDSFYVYDYSTVFVYDKTRVDAYNKSKIIAYENACIHAHDKSKITAYGHGKVQLFNDAHARVFNNTWAQAHNRSEIEAYDESEIETHELSKAVVYDRTKINAYDETGVDAYNNAVVKVYDIAGVSAYGESIVNAYDNAIVHAYGFSCIYQKSTGITIKFYNHFGAVIKQRHKVKKKMTVYKKLRDDKIAELQLVRGQTFQSELHTKCRTDQAKIIKITDKHGKECNSGYSTYDNAFMYYVGDTVKAKYDEEIKACSTGIHFFLTKKEAIDY